MVQLVTRMFPASGPSFLVFDHAESQRHSHSYELLLEASVNANLQNRTEMTAQVAAGTIPESVPGARQLACTPCDSLLLPVAVVRAHKLRRHVRVRCCKAECSRKGECSQHSWRELMVVGVTDVGTQPGCRTQK